MRPPPSPEAVIIDGKFGVVVIRGVEDDGHKTCANGLPIAQASVRMLGRFQLLIHLSHPSLCAYIELMRCQLAPNTVAIVSEMHARTVADEIGDITSKLISRANRLRLLEQSASALAYLHSAGLVHGLLSSSTVYAIPRKEQPQLLDFKLSQYGVAYITECGAEAEGAVCCGFCISPERLSTRSLSAPFAASADVWSLGLMLLETTLGVLIDQLWPFSQYVCVLQSCVQKAKNFSSASLFQYLVEAIQTKSPITNFNAEDDLNKIISSCLLLNPAERPTLQDILWQATEKQNDSNGVEQQEGTAAACRAMPQTWEWLCKSINGENINYEKDNLTGIALKMSLFDLRELFFLWKLCGANVEAILMKNDVIRLSPPVLTLPNVVVEEMRLFGNEKGRHFYTSRALFQLPHSNLIEKLKSMDISLLLPSIELDGGDVREGNETMQTSVVKEKNFAYQAFRMIFVKKLLNAGQFKEDELRRTVQFDVPPMLRAKVWASLLKIRSSDTFDYAQLDTDSEHIADRQLALDIPRCHQYDDLMCSPAAHDRLKRVVKAWLLTHPDYVYWQGCDSLAAPFMLLHFQDLATGHACMTAFIKKYLHNFFLKDNSAIIHEYLAVFAHLLAYVDAELSTRLSAMDFIPELYAIPWFLTCFAHVLPLHKLFHLWDILLLHDSSFPIFIGLAIMRQLRPSLITATFNDAILLFSDLPDLSLSRVVADSLFFYEKVPPSCAFREHKGPCDEPSTVPPHSLPMSIKPRHYLALKTWKCPRLSPEELEWRIGKERVLVVDIRSNFEFSRCCLLNALNYPNIDDDSLTNIRVPLQMAQRNDDPICIIAGREEEPARKFSSFLIELGTNGVCVLDGGFEAVRNRAHIVHVPQ